MPAKRTQINKGGTHRTSVRISKSPVGNSGVYRRKKGKAGGFRDASKERKLRRGRFF